MLTLAKGFCGGGGLLLFYYWNLAQCLSRFLLTIVCLVARHLGSCEMIGTCHIPDIFTTCNLEQSVQGLSFPPWEWRKGENGRCVNTDYYSWSSAGGCRGLRGPESSATLKRWCVKRAPPSPVVVRGREVTDPPSPLRARADEGKITGWTGPRGTLQCHPLITVASLTYGPKSIGLYCTCLYNEALQHSQYTLKTHFCIVKI